MRALGREGAGLQNEGGSETRPYMNCPYMAWAGALGNKLDAGKREGGLKAGQMGLGRYGAE